MIEQARQRATPVLIDVLRRYPIPPAGKSRVAQLMTTLDASLPASADSAHRPNADDVVLAARSGFGA